MHTNWQIISLALLLNGRHRKILDLPSLRNGIAP
jgi:hypothetical protein